MGSTALLSGQRVWEDAVPALGSLRLPKQAHSLAAFRRQNCLVVSSLLRSVLAVAGTWREEQQVSVRRGKKKKV